MKKIALLLILSILTFSLVGCNKSDNDDASKNSDVITVIYTVEGGGKIQGDDVQTLTPGNNASTVTAIANDGWVFVGWDDGTESPERQDLGVTENMVFVARFEELGDGIDGSGGDSSGESPDGEEGDKAEDAPDNNKGNSGEGEPGDAGSDSSGEGSEGKPNENDSNSKGESQDGGEGEGGQGSSGKWEDSNQFIDGKTYYRDLLEQYYQSAQDIFSADGSIPPELIEFFESYFNSI